MPKSGKNATNNKNTKTGQNFSKKTLERRHKKLRKHRTIKISLGFQINGLKTL